MELSRRSFVAGAAASAAIAATAAPLAASADEAAAPAAAEPAFLAKPAVPTDVVDEQDCDVLVIGMGLAGTAAFKAAAETGVKTIAIEKQPEESYSVIYMAGDFGVVGSQIQKDLGIEWAPKEVIMHEMQKECASRIDPWMLSYWYDHSGADFDWFVEGADFEVLKGTAAEKETDKEFYIRPKCFPRNEGYNYEEEFYPYYHGTITTNPNMQWACQAAMDAGVAAGGQIIFGAAGEQLIQDENGVVTGAYAKTDDGYIKINAKQTVLCAGDYGANKDMVAYYAPEYADYGGGVDTGDGHLMGIWAGGRMENGPHAPMAHHMGAALGVDSYLHLNNQGKRFMDEDIPGQNLTQMLCRQPVSDDPEKAAADIRSYQIFDAAWPEQIINMPDGHGYTTHFVPDEEIDNYQLVLSGFGLGYTTKQMVEDAVDYKADTLEELVEMMGLPKETALAEIERLVLSGFGLGYTTKQMVEDAVDYKADTLEELVEMMGLPKETALAEIERYNELCRNGFDEDFGKMPKRLYALENPPFYGCAFSASKYMLVMMGGLECDHDLHVIDAAEQPIPGLFVAGNNQGRRFLVDYPVIVAGISLGTALTFGRLAGANAAAAVNA